MAGDARQAAEWIDVGFVADELRLSRRAAWEFLKRIGVTATDRRMATARFRRGEYEAARDRAMEPIPPRSARPVVASAPALAAREKADVAREKAEADAARLARLKRM